MADPVQPVRMRLSRARGFNLQEASKARNGLPVISVSRPGPWGNPFVVGKHGTRIECVGLFEHLAGGLISLGLGKEVLAEQMALRAHAEKHLSLFRTHNAACWCSLPAPGQPDHCHGAVLLRWAAEQPETVAGAA